MLYLGMMSGTSMDGIDIATLETDGETISAFGPVGQSAYSAEQRDLLRQAMVAARGLARRDARPGVLAEADAMITAAHAALLRAFIKDNDLDLRDIAAVGFHGQTVLHRPERQLTVQIGDGRLLALQTGLRVVWDLRAADVAAGGQGAPLVPIYHRALAAYAGIDMPCAVVNLGGVANVTYIEGDTLMAFDTGPANALVDDWMQAKTGTAMDRDGATAAAGKVREDRVAAALKHPFLAVAPPKSADRHDFDDVADNITEGLSKQDGAATLLAFSAASLAHSLHHLPQRPKSWIMTGGGTRNPTFLAMLRDRLDGVVISADELGWQAEHIEAQAFAYLAARSLKGLPLTFPGSTGVPEPLTGGILSEPEPEAA